MLIYPEFGYVSINPVGKVTSNSPRKVPIDAVSLAVQAYSTVPADPLVTVALASVITVLEFSFAI